MTKRLGTAAVDDRRQFRHAVRSTACLCDDLDFLKIVGYLRTNVPSEVTSADSLFDWMMSTGRLGPENIQEFIIFLNRLQLHTGFLQTYVSDQQLHEINENKKRRLHDVY